MWACSVYLIINQDKCLELISAISVTAWIVCGVFESGFDTVAGILDAKLGVSGWIWPSPGTSREGLSFIHALYLRFTCSGIVTYTSYVVMYTDMWNNSGLFVICYGGFANSAITEITNKSSF